MGQYYIKFLLKLQEIMQQLCKNIEAVKTY